MKKITILFSVLVISISCFAQKSKETAFDITINQIGFEKISFTINKKTHDTLQIEGILKQKSIINKIPCCGNITFAKGWKLRKFILADDHVFAGNNFPKGTQIALSIDVQKDIKSMSTYHAVRDARNRYVNTARFRSNPLIDGLNCNNDTEIYFTTDWRLLVCILSADDTVAGNVLQKNTLLRFNNDGTIACYCLYDPQIKGYTCSGTDYTGFWMGGGGIFLYPGGQLKYFQPLDDIEIQGIWCKPSLVRGGISLYENGKLKECTSAKDQTVNGVFYGKNYTIKFDEDGNIIRSEKDKIFD